jgi:hypothetical protein
VALSVPIAALVGGVAVLIFVRFLVAVVLAAPLPGASAPHKGGLLPFCDVLPGLIADVWQGLGVVPGADDQWEKDANWSLGIAPLHLDNPYVCIPTNGAPVIRAGQLAQLVALDVDEGADLQVEQGGKLFLFGDLLTPSAIRGTVELLGGTLGGPGKVDVYGTLSLQSLGPQAPVTITTRECAYFPPPYPLGEEPCVPGVPILGLKGQIVVHDAGTVDVSGGKVILGDQFQLKVSGLLRVHDGGFVAADHGTRLELRPHTEGSPGTGTLRFEDDGDYLEGNNFFGIPALGTVVNQGLIIKTGGSGTSLVTGTYSQPAPGAVTVNTGTLLLPSGSTTPATVGAGAAYGSGRCLVPSEAGCEPQTFGLDKQNGQLKVPTTDASGASVLFRELTTASSSADIGFPVEAHATGLSATPASPAIISLRYDERLLGGRGWNSVNVYRRPDGRATYNKVLPCLANGNPPVNHQACVDRRGLPESSRNVFDAEGPGRAPDVIMVVRTKATSRWVAR